MSNLNIPIDFLEKKGSELFKVQGGFAFKSDHYSEDGYFLVRIGNVGKGRFDYKDPVYVKVKSTSVLDNFLIKENDVLMGLTGDLGKICFVEKAHNLVLNQRVARFLNDEKLIDKKYLYYLISSEEVQETFESFFAGGAQKNISPKKIEEVKYLLPSNINEQKKIAEILTKVDEAIENTEKLIQKYEQVKVGLMQDLLTKGIDENGNIRSEETHQFKDSPLGRIPVEWDCDTLGSIYKMKSGITPSRAEKSYFDDNGTNWVKTLDLNEDRLFSTEEKISKKAINFTSISVMPTDSILIAMYGGWEQIGRTSILSKPSATNQAITALFNPNKQLKSEYTMFFLQTNRWRWKQFAVSTRKDPNITKKDISNFNIAYPINETEQLYIISKIDSVKKYIDNIKSTLYKLKNQKQGLMQDLLSGKVRVNY